MQLLVVKNGVSPGPRKLPQSVNGNYGHSTQLGDGKGEFFTIQKSIIIIIIIIVFVIAIIITITITITITLLLLLLLL